MVETVRLKPPLLVLSQDLTILIVICPTKTFPFYVKEPNETFVAIPSWIHQARQWYSVLLLTRVITEKVITAPSWIDLTGK